MALAQRSQELQSLIRGLELFGQIGQIAPVQDFIDENGLVKQIISLLGLPAKMIRSDNQVGELRQQRAAAQATTSSNDASNARSKSRKRCCTNG